MKTLGVIVAFLASLFLAAAPLSPKGLVVGLPLSRGGAGLVGDSEGAEAARDDLGTGRGYTVESDERSFHEDGVETGKIDVGLALAPALVARPEADASASSPDAVPPENEAFPVREVSYDMDLRVDLEAGKLDADVRLTVENRTDRAVRWMPLVLYRLMTVRDVFDEEGAALGYDQQVVASEQTPRKQVNQVRVRLRELLPPGERSTIRLLYDGYLAGYTETGALYVRDRIDEAFTILREDALAYPEVGEPGVPWPGLPAFDYRVRVTVPATHVVANGGELLGRTVAGEQVTYEYRNLRPAWRMDFAIARYGLLEAGGFKVFYLPGDSIGADRVVNAIERSLELFTGWFGPLREPARLTIIEVPDGWGSQKDVTSMLQTAAAFEDPGRSYEIYHEVSHLWNVPPSEGASPRLEEGLASYLEDVAVEELEGQRRVEPAVERLESWVRSAFAANEKYRKTPVAAYGEERITGLSYGVGELMFYALAEIVGRETLGRIIGTYYRRYGKTGAGVSELAEVADEVAPVNLEPFFRHWLFTTEWYELLAAGGTTAEYTAAYRDAAR